MSAQEISWRPEEQGLAGGFEAAGFLTLLGKPNLRSVEILVRETVQNSWDARIGESKVSMLFAGFTAKLGEQSHETLITEVFKDLPKNKDFPSLVESLKKPNLPLLIIRDKNSHGLGGITNSREATKKGTTNRYRRFLLNIGEQGYAKLGGGAYGYGRSICFAASHSNTAIIYTRTKDDLTNFESRLIAVGYGRSFVRNGINHNGRHWWTSADADGEPIVGSRADEIAKRIGVTPYAAKESGTTIVIIDPNFGTDLKDAMTAISMSIEMHLWPKYIEFVGRPQQMSFSVTFEGKPVAVRKPAEIDPIKHYARAFEAAYKRHLVNELQQNLDDPGFKHAAIFLRSDSTTNSVGQLSVTSFPIINIVPIDEEISESNHLKLKLSQLTSNVALLREPDLIVTYLEVNKNIEPDIGTAGVFKASSEANENLRSSEPPTHDTWSNQHSEDKVRRTVKAVFRNISEFINSKVNPPRVIAGSKPTGFNSHAVAISKRIGAGIWDESTLGTGQGGGGSGGGSGSGSGSGGGGGGERGSCVISKPRLGILKNEPCVTWKITFAKSKTGIPHQWKIELETASNYGKNFSPIEDDELFPYFNGTKNMHYLVHKQSPQGDELEVTAILEKGMMATINVKRLENQK